MMHFKPRHKGFIEGLILACMLLFVGVSYAGEVTYTYDDANRLLRATSDGKVIEYVYDAVGNLLQRKLYSATLTPSSYDFGSRTEGTTTPQGFTLNNIGTETLVLGTVGLTGTNSSQFTVSADTCSGTSIAPAGSCTFNVSFSPTSAGDKNASVSVTFSTPDTLTLSSALTGNGSAPSISASPTSYDFGSINTGGTSTAQTFTISNSGGGSLILGTMSLTGTNASEFQIVSPNNCNGQTIAPQGTCTVQVAFAPATGGTKSASLTIPSNDPASPVYLVALSGMGMSSVRMMHSTPVYYETLQAAYDAALDGDTVQCRAGNLVGDLVINRNVAVNLVGGYDSAYATNSGGKTFLKGEITSTPNSGRVKIWNLVLQQ